MLLRLLLVLAVIAVAVAAGWWWQRRSGAVRHADGWFTTGQLAAVGLDPAGAEALALLLGSPTCTPCRTVREILTEVADERDRFRWTYVDAGDHLDIAEDHHVLRVPTLFVLAPDGRILARTSGVPGKRDLTAVLDRDTATEISPV